MSNGDVVWLVINALLLLTCVVILHEGVRDFNSEYRSSPLTTFLLVAGVAGTGAFAFLTLKYFGVVLANWSFAEAMRQPDYVDWATLVGVVCAAGFVLCAFVGLWATATYSHRHSRRELQQVR